MVNFSAILPIFFESNVRKTKNFASKKFYFATLMKIIARSPHSLLICSNVAQKNCDLEGRAMSKKYSHSMRKLGGVEPRIKDMEKGSGLRIKSILRMPLFE